MDIDELSWHFEIPFWDIDNGFYDLKPNEVINNFKKAADKYGAKIKYKVDREYDGFEISENEIPVKIAKLAIKKLEISPKIKSTGGGSDINIFNSKGKISVNLSAGMEKVHTSNEYVKVEQLEKLANLIIEICRAKIK